MANKFVFGGATLYAPGILVRTTVGANQVLQLLPFGTLCFVGPSDGGNGGGTVYQFADMGTAQRVLRGGELLNAITQAVNIGGATGIVAVVVGTKVAGSLSLVGSSSAAATLTAGDQGAWTNSIQISIAAGTASGVLATIFYPDAVSGVTNTVGGAGTAFDNLADFNALKAAIANDPALTPNPALGLVPVVTLTVATNGIPTTISKTSLSSGAGDGTATPDFSANKAGIDNLINVPFDVGTLVGSYDLPSQVYADQQAQLLEARGFLRRWIFQVTASVATTNTKLVNSANIVSALATAAQGLNSKRSSVVAQRVKALNPGTGAFTFVDAAPLLCGMAALLGATGENGPSTPLTYQSLPTANDVDYAVLATTGDRDTAVRNGGIVLERVSPAVPGAVRVVQSVTTAPNDGAGNPWDFGEFSVVRGCDAVLANVKTTVETRSPSAIGGGNTLKTMHAVVAEVQDVLELALDGNWITGYDPSSIQITIGGAPDADIVTYAQSPVRPLNHLGIQQMLIPFTATVNLTSTT